MKSQLKEWDKRILLYKRMLKEYDWLSDKNERKVQVLHYNKNKVVQRLKSQIPRFTLFQYQRRSKERINKEIKGIEVEVKKKVDFLLKEVEDKWDEVLNILYQNENNI